jgi:PKD domain/Secretion system C-terminal sorting domain
MKKKYFTILLFVAFINSNAQATYTSANYALVGDSFYISSATNLNLDFESTGENFNWNFENLVATSQVQLQFRNPTQTGYSPFLFPFIYFPSNTNLSSTDGTSNALNIPGQAIEISDSNDYYKKNATDVRQVASAFKLGYNGITIPVQNQYSSPDIIYQFPINYGNTHTSNSEYTTTIPTLLYRNRQLARTNTVDGWGTVTTPFGTFSNTLRITTNLVENDTISLLGTGLPRIIRTTRELKWMDTSKKIPVLTVTQTNLNGNWTTTKVDYLDNFQAFQTTALFLYSPFTPNAGGTVSFQNLSTNATTYSWNFDDPSSGVLNTSTSQNPNHVFSTNGIYQVSLTASNASFSDTITIPVVVGNILGIYDVTADTKIKVYPNPFSSKIIIENEVPNSEYELIDSSGKIIFKGTEIQKIDFSYINKGLYLLNCKANNEIQTIKLLKE